MIQQPQIADDPIDLPVAGRPVVVLREPQLGGVVEGLAHGELPVHHIVLGNHADQLTQAGEVAVEVEPLVDDLTAGGRL